MPEPDFLHTAHGRRIAYHRIGGRGPGLVFCGGLKSDMDGTKALHLESRARALGRACLRFDYSGHGHSSGRFDEGCIGDWAEDAEEALLRLTRGPQVLVGSSMGGWIALLLAQRHPGRVAGLVGIAAAPDFTEDSYWANFTRDERARLMGQGRIAIPSDHGEDYIVTRRMIEDGRNRLVLRAPLDLPFPVRLLQGTADTAVATDVPLRLMEKARCADLHLTLVKGADHRFSDPDCLKMIEAAIEEVSQRATGT